MLIPPNPELTFAVGIRTDWGEKFDAPVVVLAEVVAWWAPDRGGDEMSWRPVVMAGGQPHHLGRRGPDSWRIVFDLGEVKLAANGLLMEELVWRKRRDPEDSSRLIGRDEEWSRDGRIGRLDPDAAAVFVRHGDTPQAHGWTVHPRRWVDRFEDWDTWMAGGGVWATP